MHEGCRQPSWPEWPLKTVSVTDHHCIHFIGSFPVRRDLMWWCPSGETQLCRGTQRWRLTFSGFSPFQDTVTNDFNLEESVGPPWCDISLIMMNVLERRWNFISLYGSDPLLQWLDIHKFLYCLERGLCWLFLVWCCKASIVKMVTSRSSKMVEHH